MTPSKPIRIVIADDHEMVRIGFKKILQDKYPHEIEFVAEAVNGAKLLEAVAVYQPQVVITDIRMPVMDGIQACKIIKKEYPAIPVIAFSMFEDTGTIMSMLQAGAKGYLVKTSDHEEVVEAIKTVSLHIPYYCSTVADKIFGTFVNSNQKRQKNKDIVLGVQEKKVIQLLCQQMSTKEIAMAMNLSSKTVEHYRHNIQEKIGAKNMIGIVLYAVFHNVVKHSELGY